MSITKDIKYVGVNDHEIDLFEGQYIVPNGMAYNSYAVIDEKIAIMDSVDRRFTDEWFDNIDKTLGDRKPDYLVVQHMEPDHSSSIARFMENYPDAKLVSSALAFNMIKNFFGTDFPERKIIIKEGDKLNLGSHELNFVAAPMVHWPEVMMTYDSKDKVLFSADGFGKFGALDVEEDWACEARRYYIGIVGKYGQQVQALLKKAADLDIQKICPLHGPVLSENLEYYLNLYKIWSSYGIEEDGIVIAYTSVYGNTKQAVYKLAEMLEANGQKVVVNDLARCDWAEAVEDAFRYGKLVLATTTYNGEIFPFMKQYIDHLTERNFSNRFVAFIENGSWAPQATRIMKCMLGECDNLTFAESGVKILSAIDETNIKELEALAEELCKPFDGKKAEEEVSAAKKKFVCKICGYVHEADELEEDFKCPICKRGAEDFEDVAEEAPKKKFVCKICGYVHEAAELEEDFKCPICKRGAEDFEESK